MDDSYPILMLMIDAEWDDGSMDHSSGGAALSSTSFLNAQKQRFALKANGKTWSQSIE